MLGLGLNIGAVRVLPGGGGAGVPDDARLTEEGEVRLTEEGEVRVLEEE